VSCTGPVRRTGIHARAQDGDPTVTPEPDGRLPVALAGDPGPNSWLLEQHFATHSAYNFGDIWYPADRAALWLRLETMCGTDVLAIADGVVTNVDADSFGSRPITW